MIRSSFQAELSWFDRLLLSSCDVSKDADRPLLKASLHHLSIPSSKRLERNSCHVPMATGVTVLSEDPLT